MKDRGLGDLRLVGSLSLRRALRHPLSLYGYVDQAPQGLGYAFNIGAIPAPVRRDIEPSLAGLALKQHHHLAGGGCWYGLQYHTGAARGYGGRKPVAEALPP